MFAPTPAGGLRGPCLGLAVILLASLMAVTTARAQIKNCSFEDPSTTTETFPGWKVEYGLRACNSFSGWQATPYPATGAYPAQTPATRLSNSTALVRCQPPSPKVDPYHLSYMARLNDLEGGFHVTRISQTFTIPLIVQKTGCILTAQVGAMLVNPPGHGDCEQPGFSAELFVNNNTTPSVSIKKTANNAAAEGWQNVGDCGGPIYYKRFAFCGNLCSLLKNQSDTFRIEVTAWDCALGGHGGMAFVDRVCFLECTTPPAGMVGWWHDKTLVDLAGPPMNNGTWSATPSSVSCAYVGSSGLATQGTAYGRVPDHLDLDFPASQDFSIDLWAVPLITANSIQPLVAKLCYSAQGFSAGYFYYLENGYPSLMLVCPSTAPSFFKSSQSVAVPIGDWSHLAVTVDRSSSTPTVTFYYNGDPFTDANATPVPICDLSNSYELRLGGPPCGNAFTEIFSGCLDEIEMFRSVLTLSQVQALYGATCKGKCKPCDPSPRVGPAIWSADFPTPAPGLTPAQLGTNTIEHLCMVPAPNQPLGRYLCTMTVQGLSQAKGGAGSVDLLSGIYDATTGGFRPDLFAAPLNGPGVERGLNLNPAAAVSLAGLHEPGTVAVFTKDTSATVTCAVRPDVNSPWAITGSIPGVAANSDASLAVVRGQLWVLWVEKNNIVGAPLDPVIPRLLETPDDIVLGSEVFQAGPGQLRYPVAVTGRDGDSEGLLFYASYATWSEPWFKSELARWSSQSVLTRPMPGSYSTAGALIGGTAIHVLFNGSVNNSTTYTEKMAMLTGDDERESRGYSPRMADAGIRVPVNPAGAPLLALLLMSTDLLPGPMPIPGVLGSLLLSPAQLVAVLPTTPIDPFSGEGGLSLPIPNDPTLEGAVHIQAAILDPVTSMLSLTNNAVLRF